MKTVIFGASTFGEVALRSLKGKFDVEFFCDNDAKKHGTEFCGLKVISPDEILGKDVIIASLYHLEIAKQLIDMGIMDFYVAYDDGMGEVKGGFVNLSGYASIDTEKNKICLVSENNSGSNTLALKKLAADTEYNMVLVNERCKDTLYYYHIFTSEIVIITHGAAILDEKINIQLWHGIGVKPLGYMRKGSSLLNEPKHRTWLKLDAVFSYSQMYNLILSACFGVPETKFHITGAPRNDFLFKTDGRAILSKIMRNDFKDKKIILYAPTYRENIYGHISGGNEAYLYQLKGIDLEEFDRLLGELDYCMIVKLHPYDMEDAEEKMSGLKNVMFLTDSPLYDNDLDFYEVLNAFDGIISDYSSIVCDFMLLDRPVILMPIDIDEYRNNVGIMLEPYDFWYPGEKVYNYEQLKNALTNMFSVDGCRGQRETVMEILHKYKDGDSTRRVLDALRDVAKKA